MTNHMIKVAVSYNNIVYVWKAPADTECIVRPCDATRPQYPA